MAWLARSIANSLKLDDDEEDEKHRNKPDSVADDVSHRQKSENDHLSSSSSRESTPRGVKEDLSELTKTLRSQLWGVASFLAPQPASSDGAEHGQPSDRPEKNQTSADHEASEEEDVIAGIRSDFVEIGGRFRTGISKLSSNIAVSEFTKIASNFLQLGSEEENPEKYEVGNAIGVTEEVVAFVRDIAMHPETWLDFPLPDEDDDFDEFDMTDAQQDHALAVERLAPNLAALRIELSPGYMSESCFWKIYFVLLHPKLSKHDALLLSTPQVLEARALLSHELQKQKRNKATKQPDGSGIDISDAATYSEPLSMPPESVPLETEKHPIQSSEIQVIDKSVVEEKPIDQEKPPNPPNDSSRVLAVKPDDDDVEDADDWLKEEETSESVGLVSTTIPLGNDEDVSFSDLEDEEGDVPVSYKKATSGSEPSAKNSPDWVRLKDIEPVGEKRASSGQVRETKESNDWLDVDDIDVI